MFTDNKFPDKDEAIKYLTDEIAEQLELQDKEELIACYNNYGSFKLDKFTKNFNQDFFEHTNDLTVFAKNFKDKLNRNSGGCALLSKDTIAKGTSSGSSQYPGTIFDTGHILGFTLIGNMPEFNSSKNNFDNIFPQTPWANGRAFMLETNRGNSQHPYEQLVFNLIKKSINKDVENFRVFYKVDLIYHRDESVPRGIHIQAISNNKKILKKINVFIPNVRYKEHLEIDYSDVNSEVNKMNFDPKIR